MRRFSHPLALALSVALACGDSDSGPRDPYEAAPVAEGVAGGSTFLQFVPNEDDDDAYFPGATNHWELQSDFGLSDGSNDQFDGAVQLYVGTLATRPATWESIYDETWDLEEFPWDQEHSELTYYEPTLGAAALPLAAVADETETYLGVLEGTYSAHIAPTGDSRLQQAVDLAGATGAVTLSWVDSVNAYTYYFDEGATYRVVLRSPTTGEILETALSTNSSSGPHELDLTAYAGQRVVLSFEFRSAVWGYALVDSISIQDEGAAEFVANGDFETGDLAGWTTATAGLSQNVVSGARTVNGLEVTRGFYTAPGSLWARYVDVFENPGAAAVTADVVYYTNLGSDGAGILYPTPGADDRAITTWDGMGYDRDIALVIGTGQAFYQSNPNVGTWSGGSDSVFVLHTITVPSGGKVAIVQFVLLNGIDTGSLETTVDATARAVEMDAAAAAVANGVGEDPAFLDWMTADQRAATVANW